MVDTEATSVSQVGILAPVPVSSRHVTLRLRSNAEPKKIVELLTSIVVGDDLVVGIGAPLVAATAMPIPGLRPFPALAGAKIGIPSTQHALWCWFRGTDRGEIVHRSRELLSQLAPAFEVGEILDTFRYADSRDLSGYIDGTENPEGAKAVAAALVDGGSFVAVQTWLHDLDHFMALPEEQRDRIVGRRHSDNEEIATAPESSHVKRTAQESFEPPAFVLRRSMPWTTGSQSGLQFVAFGCTLDRYEAILRRMVGLEDGIVDALFQFSRPLTGGYYFCPPLEQNRLRLPR